MKCIIIEKHHYNAVKKNFSIFNSPTQLHVFFSCFILQNPSITHTYIKSFFLLNPRLFVNWSYLVLEINFNRHKEACVARLFHFVRRLFAYYKHTQTSEWQQMQLYCTCVLAAGITVQWTTVKLTTLLFITENVP